MTNAAKWQFLNGIQFQTRMFQNMFCFESLILRTGLRTGFRLRQDSKGKKHLPILARGNYCVRKLNILDIDFQGSAWMAWHGGSIRASHPTVPGSILAFDCWYNLTRTSAISKGTLTGASLMKVSSLSNERFKKPQCTL